MGSIDRGRDICKFEWATSVGRECVLNTFFLFCFSVELAQVQVTNYIANYQSARKIEICRRGIFDVCQNNKIGIALIEISSFERYNRTPLTHTFSVDGSGSGCGLLLEVVTRPLFSEYTRKNYIILYLIGRKRSVSSSLSFSCPS